MFWLLITAVAVVIIIIAVSFWRVWVRPWTELEELVRKLIKSEPPTTFILNGNRAAERIGVWLEDVFLRQQENAKRAQQSEVDVNAILEAMGEGLAVIDESAAVRVLNRAARELFAVPLERIGSDIMETFRDPLIANVTTRTLRDRETVTEWITVRGNSQSEDRRIAVTSLPMRADGAGAGAVLLFEDVTELQHLEQVRREFVSNVSHELRTPLSIFRGYIETLLDEPDLAVAERERILRVMEKHSTRLHALVDDLLSLARLETPQTELNFAPLSLAEFVSRIMDDWGKKTAAKRLRISAEIADDLPFIQADEARLEEVLYNLLDNAVKYSSSGGAIVVRATRDGEAAVLSVSDQGTGIGAADLPRIFERFYRADKARSRELGGTGLGLTIVKHIVQLHGGQVQAESELGRGTKITVKLPLAREFTRL